MPFNPCCEPIASTCVTVVPDLSSGTYLYPETKGLNDFILEVDRNMTIVRTASTLPASAVISADSCKLLDLTGLIHRDNKVTRADYIHASDLVLKLVSQNCVTKSRLDSIYEGDTLSDAFLNYKLPSSLRDKISCLNCDAGCDPKYPDTLRDLIEILVAKIIAYESENAKLACKDCQCINC